MLGKDQLKQLRAQKKLLVLQSNANRLLLTADWQRLRTAETWKNEAGNLVRQHPIWATALAAVTGVMAFKTVRQPGLLASGIGRLGRVASTAFSAWKLFRSKKNEP